MAEQDKHKTIVMDGYTKLIVKPTTSQIPSRPAPPAPMPAKAASPQPVVVVSAAPTKGKPHG